MLIEMRNIALIRPYDHNPRDNDGAVDAVVASIREFGWRQPVVLDAKGVIICGHTRFKAAQRMGLKQVPVHVATDLTATQVKAYRLADNATNEIAEWNYDLLPLELLGLKEEGFDLDLLGFDAEELARLMSDEASAGLTDPDAVPQPPEVPVTQPGDLWLLGQHRLFCGDATNADHVSRLLDGAVPFLMVSDPPYGVSYDPEWRHRTGLNNSQRTGRVANDDRVDWTDAYKLFPGHVVYIWHAGRFTADVQAHLAAAGFEARSQIIWRKTRFAISRSHYHWQHEPCWYCVRAGGTAKWCQARDQSTIWDIASRDQDAQTCHGTQKPVECMARPIRNHGGRGDDVYDPFLGSGTTLIACERLGRRCFGLELSPVYCDVAAQRWEQFTGKKGTRVPAGEGPAGRTTAAAAGNGAEKKGRRARTEKTPAIAAGVGEGEGR
jgi:DNA modification methylase